MGKGLAYSGAENLAIAQAWIQVSESPTIGKDRKLKDFWNEVYDAYKSKLGQEEHRAVGRDGQKLSGQWRLISRDVSKFNGYMEQVRSLNESGCTADDQRKKAATLFQTEIGEEFKYQNVWDYLKDKPKWKETGPLEKRVKRRDSLSTATRAENSEWTYPVGTKRAKTDAVESKLLLERQDAQHREMLKQAEDMKNMFTLALAASFGSVDAQKRIQEMSMKVLDSIKDQDENAEGQVNVTREEWASKLLSVCSLYRHSSYFVLIFQTLKFHLNKIKADLIL